jgi:hypothetical protein
LWRRPRPKLGCGAKERRRRRKQDKYPENKFSVKYLDIGY